MLHTKQRVVLNIFAPTVVSSNLRTRLILAANQSAREHKY